MNPPVTLKRVARIVAGQSPSSADVEPLSVGLPFIQGNAEFGSNGPNPIWECVDPPKRAIAGDVLVSVRAPVGAVTVADRDYGIGRGLNAVRAEKIDPTYLIWLLRNSTGYLNSIATGSTFAAITSSDVASVGVPITPLDEQRQIAEYLDRETGKIDELITKQEQLVELLGARRQAVVDSATWRGVHGAQVSDSGVEPAGDSPAHWARVRNKNLFRERTGLSDSGTEELLTVSHITGVTPRSEKNVTMTEAVSLSGYKVVEISDLVINTLWGWMGALGTSQYRGIVSPAYGVYAPHGDLEFDPRYFGFLYRSSAYVAEIGRHSKGLWSSRLRIYPDSFLALRAVVPPLEEQREIVRHIDEATAVIDALRLKASELADALRERRAALISAAVTGKIDVRGL